MEEVQVDWKVVLQMARDSNHDSVVLMELAEEYQNHFKSLLIGEKSSKGATNKNGDISKALRFFLILSSCNDSQVRDIMTVRGKEFVTLLVQYLSRKNQGEQYSSKCSTLSARLLSNLCTTICSGESAPSQFLIDQNHYVDMIATQGSAGNRDALAAVVASLNNSICHLSSNDNPLYKREIEAVAGHKLLMSNLIRYILPVTSVTQQDGKGSNLSSVHTYDNNCSNVKENPVDDGTEWITRVISKLFHLGFFREMCTAVSATNENKMTRLCTLEEVVLLHCIDDIIMCHIESNMRVSDDDRIFFSRKNRNKIEDVIIFLADEAKVVYDLYGPEPSKFTIKEQYAGEQLVSKSMHATLIDILSSMLIVIDNFLGEDEGIYFRLCLLRRTSILEHVIFEIKQLIDKYSSEEMTGKKIRELSKIVTEDEKRCITTMIRLIGNLSYRCRTCQDMLRKITFPLEGRQNVGLPVEITAVHIVLSITSLSYVNFGIREWSVVAIRNILEDNIENQKIVEELKAQTTIQSPELSAMGISVDIEENGKVKVTANAAPNSKT